MSDLVKALEDLLEEPVHCTRCGYYGHFVNFDPVQSPCGRCDELGAVVERARKALDAVPVLTWKKRKDGVRVARLHKCTLDVVPLPYEPPHKFAWSITIESPYSYFISASGLGKTLAQAKRRAMTALRKEGVVFRTVRK